jgi:hypothetical protein
MSLGRVTLWPPPRTMSTTSRSRNKSHESSDQQVRFVDSTSNTCVKTYLGFSIARTTSRTVWCVRRLLYTAEQDLRCEIFSTPSSPAGNFVHLFSKDMFYLESCGIFYDTLLRHSLRPVSLFLLHRFHGYAYSGTRDNVHVREAANRDGSRI